MKSKIKKRIKALETHTYAPELNTIHFIDGTKIKTNKIEDSVRLKKAMYDKDFKTITQIIRGHRKCSTPHKKWVKIKYTCTVFSTVSGDWHNIKDTLACGVYQNITEIKKLIENKRIKNNYENIKDLKFHYEFKMK